MAFQRAVIEGNGLKIRKIFVIYVNNEYVRHGAIVPTELTKMDDVTLAVHNLAAFTESNMPLALETMKSDTMPDPNPIFLSKMGDKKEWQAIYDSLTGADKPDYSDAQPTYQKHEIDTFLGEPTSIFLEHLFDDMFTLRERFRELGMVIEDGVIYLSDLENRNV